ncbi:hypothetical protein DCAR_0104235 [Daucus carota subsp. sativus]|nr:hypothetical protein DCAR_0104235 [Daucus carota subsp. sativus]
MPPFLPRTPSLQVPPILPVTPPTLNIPPILPVSPPTLNIPPILPVTPPTLNIPPFLPFAPPSSPETPTLNFPPFLPLTPPSLPRPPANPAPYILLPPPSFPETPTLPAPLLPVTPIPYLQSPPAFPFPFPPIQPGSPAVPRQDNKNACPRDVLKLGVCGDMLGRTMGPLIGSPPKMPCCRIMEGLLDFEAAVCLCSAIRANVMGTVMDFPVAISHVFNNCQKDLPSGFECE